MERSWEINPAPQLREHAPLSVHGVISQSIGHMWVLQSTFCSRGGHSAPPCPDSFKTSRICICAPPPQRLSHSPTSFQSDTSQSTGHGVISQPSSSRAGPSTGFPPYWAWVWTVRSRLRFPGPHSWPHLLHSFQSFQTPSTGHGLMRHGSSSSGGSGHSTPPWRGSVSKYRVRFLVPSSQLVEHFPQLLHSDQTQSTGQGSMLHTSNFSKDRGQRIPPNCGGTVMCRETFT